MKWANSLIRIANHEVETLQKRLAEIVERRASLDMRMAALHAEADAEADRARRDHEAALFHAQFAQGWRVRRGRLQADIEAVMGEEAGARDSLTRAFEELKKFEHVAELARIAGAKELNRRETAAMDEMGLRVAAGGRG